MLPVTKSQAAPCASVLPGGTPAHPQRPHTLPTELLRDGKQTQLPDRCQQRRRARPLGGFMWRPEGNKTTVWVRLAGS